MVYIPRTRAVMYQVMKLHEIFWQIGLEVYYTHEKAIIVL